MKLELNSTKIIEQITGDLKNIENIKNIDNQNKFVQELNKEHDTEYILASLIMKKAIEYTLKIAQKVIYHQHFGENMSVARRLTLNVNNGII